MEKIEEFLKNIDKYQYSSYFYNDILHDDTNLKNMLKIDNLTTSEIIQTPESNKEYQFNKYIYNIATEFITAGFFKDENKENIFKFQYLINKSFNKMTKELINIINNYITEKRKKNPNVEFLKYTDIIFLYKGGTTLKILFDKYVNIYANTNNNNFFEFFKENFKRSDSDYVIMINPNITIERNGITFAYVYKLVNKHVTDILYNIGLFIFKDGISDNNILKKPINDENILDFITKLQKLFDQLKEIRDKIQCDKYLMCTEIVGIGYYDKEIKVKIKKDLPMEQHHFSDITEKIKSDFVVITKHDNKTILGKPTEDLKKELDLIYTDINFSINDTIENVVRDDKINSFCLQRLKINLIVYFKNIFGTLNSFKCPGELIDIVILKQDSYNLRSFYDHIEFEYSKYIYKISEYTLEYNSYTLYGHIQDLLYILFITSKFPWDDPKYKKRIDRLILFIIFEHIEKNNNNETLIEIISQYKNLFNYLISKNQEFEILHQNNKMNEYFLNNLYKLYTYPEIILEESNKVNLSEMLAHCLIIFDRFNPANIYNPNSLEKSISLLNLQGSRVEQIGGVDKNIEYKQKYLKYKKKYLELKQNNNQKE